MVKSRRSQSHLEKTQLDPGQEGPVFVQLAVDKPVLAVTWAGSVLLHLALCEGPAMPNSSSNATAGVQLSKGVSSSLKKLERRFKSPKC